MISLAFTLAAAAVVLWVGIGFYVRYRAATGTTWQRIVAAERGMQVILLQKVTILVSAVGVALGKGTDLIATLSGDPEFAAKANGFISAYFTPTNVMIAAMAFSALTIWARLRPKV
ncbi:MAG TPA: hypothetical protein VFB45_15350 [Pseudolabrys sp.]|nr:hypothetical protein [Pseudolabrys sp.]